MRQLFLMGRLHLVLGCFSAFTRWHFFPFATLGCRCILYPWGVWRGNYMAKRYIVCMGLLLDVAGMLRILSHHHLLPEACGTLIGRFYCRCLFRIMDASIAWLRVVKGGEAEELKNVCVYIYISGWWFQPLWKIRKSVGMIIPNIWKKCSNPWNHIYIYVYIILHILMLTTRHPLNTELNGDSPLPPSLSL
jgi:hypothetical protein